MQASSLLLLGVLSFLGQGLVLAKSGDCSCLGLANVRKMVPEDAGQAKQLLYEAWKITQKDICRSTFQSLPISSLGLGRRRRKDVNLGPFVKMQAKELKTLASQFFWESWVQNVNIPQDKQQLNSAQILVNQTLEGMERNIEGVLEKMQILTENIISEMEEMVPNLDFLARYVLNIDDVKSALKGIACSWTTEQTNDISLKFQFIFSIFNFERVIKTTGVENVDVEKARAWAGDSMKVLSEKVATKLIKNIVEKFKSLVLSLSSEFYHFQDFLFEIQSGKDIKFESIVIRILEEIQSDNFLMKMDQGFAAACQMRSEFLNNYFLAAIEQLSDLGSQAITGNNKIDLNKLLGLFKSSDQNIDEWIDNLCQPLDRLAFIIQEDKLFNEYFLPLVLPQSQERTCSEDRQILEIKAKLLTAGAIQALLKMFNFM